MARTDQSARVLLEPAFLSKLQALDLIARMIVEGFLTGLHKSPYHGFSVEFAEHRQYIPGDPIHHIDWKVYAKSDRFMIKEYEQETNLRSYLMIDVSSSTPFADEGRIEKIRYATYLAAALAYLMLQQQDAVGLLLFSDHVHKIIPARSARSHLRILFREMEAALRTALATGKNAPRHRTDVGPCLETLADRIPRRGLMVLISDLWDPNPDRILRALKHFRHRQHEVVVFHLQDPREVRFDYRDETIFVDMETNARLNVQPWELRDGYKRLMEERIDLYRKQCGANRIAYERVLTDTPFDVAMLRYLEKRSRLH
ncbi:MAG: DUF58 domain-containing protein [Candidatus Eisenbacteria bacterium]|nr:DUF58 domain-containing protein [Candidatus Latescibacterota bacterium]MBD3302182.1 DUF58 domain-containing protein [Candidatus Eisenbacteria bacterium]